jgi:Cu2+-exporting ATPase
MFRKKFWISLMLSLPVLIFSQTVQGWLGYTLPDFPLSNWIVPVMSTVVFIVGGLPFLRMAKGELEDKKPGMMTLISLAILVAFFYSLASTFFHLGSSFYWELVTLIDVMLLGHWIEMRSIRQASGALDELSKLLPDKASKVNENGEIETVKVSELKKGDIVLIRPGESVPADGVVVEGQSNLNEAMITGESTPVPKQEGDTLVSGTINGDGSLRAKVTAVGEETTLAGIMRLVKEAQQSKSQTQILADRAAGWLFYTALGVAVITAIVWFLAVGWNIEILKRVTSVLVIACPHALGLAIPLVVAISTSIGASHGILIRDRVALESARKLDTIIFDKTGTLTHGEFGLQAMESIESISLERALSLAAAVERDSEHPLAKAIRDAAEGKIEAEGITGMTDSDLEIPPAESFEAIKGKGAKALVEGEWYLVGSERLLEEKGIALESTLSDFTDRHSTKGETVVYLIHADEALAAFALADRIRKASFETIDQLHQEGYRVAMLTGDSEEVARSVAEALEIDIVFAEVLPENKDRKVSELQEKGQRVAMVGDGVNDAPALTRADVGIAIGSGTDVAVESAGIILVDNDPKDILRVIRLSRETYQKMVQNLIWATGYNVIALPLAAGVLAPIRILLPPAVGALIMSLSTVIVAANAQLLRRLSEDL